MRWCFETVVGCPLAEVDHPGMAEPTLVARFPGGRNLSIEFIPGAPDDERPRLGAWLELRTEDPAAAMPAMLDQGLPEVKHPGHPCYFMAPGGRVLTFGPAVRRRRSLAWPRAAGRKGGHGDEARGIAGGR